jgi:glycerol kinase
VPVLAIDQGTSSTKAIVVDDDGAVIAEATQAVGTRATADRITQDPNELLSSVIDTGREALARAGVVVDAVGLANQGETVLAWDRASGAPESPAISWQDGRAAVVCERIRDHAARLHELTGLPLDPYFSAPKLAWLREQGATGVVTTSDAWLIHKLTGEFVTDVTTASRSMVLELESRQWSDEALEIFGLSSDSMPSVTTCAEVVGHTTAFGADIPVAGLAVDQQAALVAQGCMEAGLAKCTYGTGAFLLLSTGATPVRSMAGLSSSVAFEAGGAHGYCLDGQSYSAGAAISWLARVGLLGDPAALDRAIDGALDRQLVAVPALAGLGSPWWSPSTRGTIEGLGLETTADDITRAMIEGVCAQIALLCAAAIKDMGLPLRTLRVDGGLTRSSALLQIQADLLQIPVEVSPSPDATALGVAALARCGRDGGSFVPPTFEPVTVVEPSMSADEAAHRLARFEAAVARAIEAST